MTDQTVAEAEAGRRSVWRISVLGALLLGGVAAGVAAVRDEIGDSVNLAVLAIVALVLLVHLWASRWRWWMSVPLTLVPAVLLIVGAADDAQPGTSYGLVAAGAAVAVLTLALCVAAANRWGRVEGSRLDVLWRL